MALGKEEVEKCLYKSPDIDSGTIFPSLTMEPLQFALVYFFAWHHTLSIGLSSQ